MRKLQAEASRTCLTGIRLWLGLWLGLCSCSPEDPRPPLVFDRSGDLFSRLEEFELREGFLHDDFHLLRTRQDATRDLNPERMRVALPPRRATIASPLLVLDPESTLDFEIGIDPLPFWSPGKALVSYRFEIHLETSSDTAELFAEVLTCRGGARPAPPERRAVALPAGAKGGRLLFRTTPFPDASSKVTTGLVPAWWSPVLHSAGRQGRWEDHPIEFEELVLDLLHAPWLGPLDSSLEADRSCPDHPRHEIRLQQSRQVQMLQSFAVLENPRNVLGRSHPAVVFSGNARFSLFLPAGEDLEMQFWSAAESDTQPSSGSLSIEVHVASPNSRADPQEQVFSQKLDERSHPSGFVRRVVPLPARAGCCMQVTVRLETTESGRIGLGRPRIVRRRQVARQLAERGPNVVLVVGETLRADELGVLGSELGLTPTLDRLAEQGRLYVDAQSASSWTAPSVASMLTGLYPPSHGVMSTHHLALSEPNETLAEVLAQAGITCGAWVASPVLEGSRGYGQGFEVYRTIAYARGKVLNRSFEHWLAARPGMRFFAYLHYFEPHDPYEAPGKLREQYVPEGLADMPADSANAIVAIRQAIERDDQELATRLGRFLRGRYRGEIAALDGCVQDLLDVLERSGTLENTILVFTSDHGEEFLEHGLQGHGLHLHREVLHVPLFLFGPRFIEPARVQRPVENVALFASICDWFGVPGANSERRPALPANEQDRGAETLLAMLLQGAWPPREGKTTVFYTGLRQGPYMLTTERMAAGAPQLYDLEADPGETRNLLGEDPTRDATLRRQLEAMVESCLQPQSRALEGSRDEELESVLRTLGYLAAEEDGP